VITFELLIMFKLSHIGIAVRDLKASVNSFSVILGLAERDFSYRDAPSEGVRIAEVDVGGLQVEVMEPMSEDSPISAFLRKRGEGVHHLCFEVDDIDEVWKRLKAEGVEVLGDKPKKMNNYYYFFIHPKSAGGVLIEFKQTIEKEL